MSNGIDNILGFGQFGAPSSGGLNLPISDSEIIPFSLSINRMEADDLSIQEITAVALSITRMNPTEFNVEL